MKFPKAYALAFEAARIANSNFHNKLAMGLLRYPAPGRSSGILALSEGRSRPQGFLTLASEAVRNAACGALIEAVLSHHAQTRRDPSNRTYLATFAWDAGLTFEDSPHVNMEAMERKVRRCLTRLGFDAVCAFEVDVLSNCFANETARRLQFHIHAICWRRDLGFEPIAVGTRLSNDGQFPNSLGIPGVSFVSRAQSASRYSGFQRRHPDRDQTAGSMAWLAHYLLKAPYYAKNRYLGRDGRPRVRGDVQRFTPCTAILFAEILTQISAFDAVFAVGSEGAKVGTDYAKRLREWERSNRSNPKCYHEDVLKYSWADLFRHYPQLGFSTATIRQRRHSLTERIV